MSKSGALALALAGSPDRAPATSAARLSRMPAAAWTRPMKAPCPPPIRPMRSLRLSGALVGMERLRYRDQESGFRIGTGTAAGAFPGCIRDADSLSSPRPGLALCPRTDAVHDPLPLRPVGRVGRGSRHRLYRLPTPDSQEPAGRRPTERPRQGVG